MSGIFNYLVNILIVLVGGVFSSLRIHAINGQRWFWTSLVLVLICGSAPFYLAGLLVTAFHSYKGSGLPIARGCYEATPHLEYTSWNWGAVAVQACGCVGSAIDLGFTWYRTKDIVSVVRTTRTKPLLASSMLQSARSLPRAALTFNTIQFYFFVMKRSEPCSIDSILMSRFILNLRLLDGRDPALEMSTASGLPTLVSRCPGQIGGISALALANLGAPLDFDGEPDGDDEEDDELHLLDMISSRN
ncbi:hypothetical protein LXA43DRAFT_1069995 [Ganoderma leucocontextum]|nr:hypothetical protein LXA43DRAFT_1069995 [Ganoderma leucocontextum]